MAVKGTDTKKYITDKILSTFEGSFLCNDGKEIRIPKMENGELVQIKVALTCAKTNVEMGADAVLPGENKTENGNVTNDQPIEVSQAEKEKVQKLVDFFSL